MTEEQWFLIELGCAECGDMPLALPRGVFGTEDEAKTAAGGITERGGRWIDHPNGGSFKQWGSGGMWVGPVSALEMAGTEFGSEYDETYR
jgi:hypothetical protein